MAYWAGRLFLGRDIRQYGNGNPGAVNVWRAGGRKAFAVALLLEFLKGALPIWLGRSLGGLSGPRLVPPALAAPLGHACSPLLGFRGGKALAVTFGVWSGLTGWRAPLLLGGLFGLMLRAAPPEARAVRLGMVGFDLLLGLAAARRKADPWLLATALGHTALLFWTHRRRPAGDGGRGRVR